MAVGMSLQEAVSLSNIAAGLVVAKLGTATVSPMELSGAACVGSNLSKRGVLDEDALVVQIKKAKSNGECIIMTNGCFDLLHPGHIDYLEKARAMGDRLVVAVNDDASVKRLKGETRPINTLSTRMRMLSALGCVDWVVPFTQDTPEQLYCRLLPDILVKGGDYTEEHIVGASCVKAAGGEVRIIEFSPGYSTTALINKIEKV